MNLSEYRTLVRDALGVPVGDTTIPNDSFDKAINAALRHIGTSAEWPWLVAEESIGVSANSQEITPNPDWVKTLHLIGDWGELGLRSMSDVLRLHGLTGRPRIYAPKGGKLLIAPASNINTSLRHIFVRDEKVLILDGDTPFLPDEHSGWVVSEACVRLALRTNRADRVVQFREEAITAKRAAIDNVRRTSGLPRIRRTRTSVWPEGY
jgi:hypothetical protein